MSFVQQRFAMQGVYYESYKNDPNSWSLSLEEEKDMHGNKGKATQRADKPRKGLGG